jgi:hypothetical protein
MELSAKRLKLGYVDFKSRSEERLSESESSRSSESELSNIFNKRQKTRIRETFISMEKNG